MTTQDPQSAGPERRDPQMYRRTRVARSGANATAPRRGGADRDNETTSSADVVELESAEVALLALLSEGLTPVGIGRRLGVHERTVRRRINRLCQRLGVSTPMEAVVWAVRRGVI